MQKHRKYKRVFIYIKTNIFFMLCSNLNCQYCCCRTWSLDTFNLNSQTWISEHVDFTQRTAVLRTGFWSWDRSRLLVGWNFPLQSCNLPCELLYIFMFLLVWLSFSSFLLTSINKTLVVTFQVFQHFAAKFVSLLWFCWLMFFFGISSGWKNRN